MNIFNLCWLKRKVLILFSFFVILTGLIFYGGRSYAADALSLKMLIKNALKNPNITSSILKTEGLKEKIAITKALPEPVAGIGLTDANGFNNPGIGVNSMSDIGLSISQKIPFPSKLETKSRINKYSYMSSKAKTRALKIDTAYLVKESYYNLALLEKQIIVVKYNRLLLNMILKDISQKYGTGSASAPAYIRTMLEDAGLKSELFSLNKAKAKLIYLLSELTGFEPSYIKSRRAVLPKIKEVGKRDKTKEDIKTAYKYNPELKSLKYLAKKSDYETAYAKESYLPDFYLKAGYGDRYSMVPVLSASVGLSLPVYFNSYQKPLINKAEKDKLSSIYALSWERLQIIKNIGVYAKDLRINKNNFKLYENLYVPEAKLLFKAEISSFGTGKSSAFSLLDSFRKLIDSEFKRDIYNAKYYIDKSRLEQVMGKIR
ncbi:MAG: TolC family protein [Candidatus Acidulodesulfobacterium acidiphilum]|uniref:TolC family protein n=1 Tax=Candidatus Acidulodesulfobacterium acidiphilum TaxID=2597224 RepID=A0A520X8I2_9DELT|nr:MAG: TolC family protein [Candidatus Acidulodesulfobacterium acidiphilum]